MKLAHFLLRVGLAMVFLYAAAAAYLTPENWIGFLPAYFRMPLVLALFSIYQLVLAVWLLSGRAVFWSATFSSATLLAIIFQNIFLLDIVFRDVAILFAALALMALSYKTPQQ